MAEQVSAEQAPETPAPALPPGGVSVSEGKATPAPAPGTRQTLADAGDALDADERVSRDSWPDDWRQRLAGDDPKALKQLERFSDPSALWKKLANQDKVIRERKASPAKPPPDADPEVLADYRKTMGIPDAPDGYLKAIDDKVLGEDDKPVFLEYAQKMHEINAPPEVVKAGVDWYLEQQERMAVAVTEADDQFRVQSRDQLRDEWGPSDFKRNLNAINSLFKDVDQDTQASIFNARLPDGKLLGDHPEVIKLFAQWATEVNPAATVVRAGTGDPGKTINAEISDIENTMRTDRRRYDQDENMQERYRELLEAREKMKSRAA